MVNQKLEDVKWYDKINLEGDWVAYPDDVSVFIKALLPYIKHLENRITELESKSCLKTKHI